MKENIIILAENNRTEDAEFILPRLRPHNLLAQRAIIHMFSSIDLVIGFLETCKAGYEFKFLIHISHSSGSADKEARIEIINRTISESKFDLSYNFTTRSKFEDYYAGVEVFRITEVERKDFDLNKLKTNRVGETISDSLIEAEKPQIAILTALEKDELEVFKKNSNIISQNELNNLNSFSGYFNEKDRIGDHGILYYAAPQERMGMVEASAYATNIIRRLPLKYLIMSGVCGGLKTKVKMYDIIVANKVTNNLHGKYDDGEFKIRPQTVTVNAKLIGVLSNQESIDRIKRRMEDLCDNDYLKNIVKKVEIHFKNYTCTDFVVKKDGYLANENANLDENVIGLEMESYGFLRASELYLKSGFAFFAKSVMDYTDMKKVDKNNGKPIKNTAAYMSYLFNRAVIPILLENYDLICQESNITPLS